MQKVDRPTTLLRLLQTAVTRLVTRLVAIETVGGYEEVLRRRSCAAGRDEEKWNYSTPVKAMRHRGILLECLRLTIAEIRDPPSHSSCEQDEHSSEDGVSSLRHAKIIFLARCCDLESLRASLVPPHLSKV